MRGRYDLDVFDQERDVSRRRDVARRALPASVHGSEGRLASLQRQAGNGAVAWMLQRAPKDRPASTDAPGKHPKPRKAAPKKSVPDVKGRVIGVRVEDGQTVITISVGSAKGVEIGMDGSMLDRDGKEYADFQIEKVAGGTSIARVSATTDQVSDNPNVIIKASKFAGEDLSDKSF